MPPVTAQSAALVAAALVPGALAFNLPPSPTLFNQVAAVACFGLVLTLLRDARSVDFGNALRHSAALQAAMALLAAAALWSCVGGTLPAGLALSTIGLMLMVMVLAAAGSAVTTAGVLPAAFFAGWVVAGCFSVLVALVQVFAPGLADGNWIANTTSGGRAVGNMRQPNHLSSLLLWSAAALVPLVEAGRLKRWLGTALFAAMVFGVMLSGSRTGLVGVGVLAFWGLLDRRLTRASRGLLLASPFMYGGTWALTAWWSALQQSQAIGAATRMGQSDLSSARFDIWRDTLELIRAQPWFGVGFGEFNFAWTLTPLPQRPLEFFDHTHNLPLQLAVELGLPLAALVLALMLLALWQAWRRSRAVTGEGGGHDEQHQQGDDHDGLHSQLEYPLWYAHFLLPTALLWGLCLGAAAAPALESAAPRRWPVVCGMAMLAAAAAALVDFQRVVVIFSPPSAAAPLEERIADGQRSWLFAHHADYAAATTAERPADAMAAFRRAPHHLLDTRLMIAWAQALAQSGDVDRARHLAARLREFHNPAAAEFFAPCSDATLQPRPFQCEPPTRRYSWRDFR